MPDPQPSVGDLMSSCFEEFITSEGKCIQSRARCTALSPPDFWTYMFRRFWIPISKGKDQRLWIHETFFGPIIFPEQAGSAYTTLWSSQRNHQHTPLCFTQVWWSSCELGNCLANIKRFDLSLFHSVRNDTNMIKYLRYKCLFCYICRSSVNLCRFAEILLRSPLLMRSVSLRNQNVVTLQTSSERWERQDVIRCWDN